MTERVPRRYSLHRFGDAPRIDAEMPVQVCDRGGLTEVLNTKRSRPVPAYGAEPAQCRRMAIDDCDKPAIGRQAGQNVFDMADGRGVALLAGFLRPCPIRIKTIRRGDRKKAHIAAILPDEAGCVNC